MSVDQKVHDLVRAEELLKEARLMAGKAMARAGSSLTTPEQLRLRQKARAGCDALAALELAISEHLYKIAEDT